MLFHHGGVGKKVFGGLHGRNSLILFDVVGGAKATLFNFIHVRSKLLVCGGCGYWVPGEGLPRFRVQGSDFVRL